LDISLLLVLDDFEVNLEARDGEYLLQPEAAKVLEALVWAIKDTYAPHRLILTCRYQFASPQLQHFYQQPLDSMRGADLRKKCSRLSAFGAASQVEEALQAEAKRLADGNPRLLEWLDKVLVDATVDQEVILQGLAEENSVELREQVLAEELLQQINPPLREMLARGLVFKLPVPREALVTVCAGIPQLEQQLARAVSLGLLAVSPDGGLRVPRILPLELGENQGLFKEAAEVLYRLWREEGEDEQLEIHRLAMRGKVEKIAIEVAHRLTSHWIKRSRYRETVELCQKTLGTVTDYRLVHNLAFAEHQLGEVEQASQDYQQALAICPTADEKEKSAIIHNLGSLKANTGDIPGAIALYEQSLEIKESIGDLQGKAATLHQRGILKTNTGDIAGAIALYEQSLEIKESIGNMQGKASTLHQLGSLKANTGDIPGAIALYEQSLETFESIGNLQGKASTLHNLGNLTADTGDIPGAIALYEQSLETFESIGDLQGKAATLHEMGRLKANTGDIPAAITLYEQSLEITESIGNMQGKAATLHEMGMLKANTGDIPAAITLYEQSLEITESIGNMQVKASTLAMLGQLLVTAQEDYKTGLDYLQQSLDILQHLQSPEAENVKEIIADVKKRIKN
ncbi:MAG: tetratricopeptide repeat protein, partial [Symploca sp. SIO3E6]|nr:tetratricopeptide repeat protein [Caldora sp. SIO3E6]